MDTEHSPALQRPDGGPVRVLVVDDEPDLTEVLSAALRRRGLGGPDRRRRRAALAGGTDFRPTRSSWTGCCPTSTGCGCCARCGERSPDVCVLFLTARDAVEDRIAGITAGGDDYVTKPFSLEEVLARLRGLLRRAGMAREPEGDRLVVGDLVMDEEAREVSRAGVTGRAVPHRVRTAALPDAQPPPGAVQGADPRPGVVLRLRRPGARRRALHQLSAQEDRRRPRPDDPHGARRRLRAQAEARSEAALLPRTLRGQLTAGLVALLALACLAVGVTTVLALRGLPGAAGWTSS